LLDFSKVGLPSTCQSLNEAFTHFAMTGFRAPRARAKDDSVHGTRWTKSWVEAVGGQRLVEPLAKDLGLALDDRQRLLLNRFGDLVESVIFSGAVNATYASVDAAAQLDELLQIVRDEASSAIDSLSKPAKEAVAEVDVFQSEDTGLPVLHLTVSQAPKLVVMVSRSYFSLRTGVSYGFKTVSGSSASRPTSASPVVAKRRLDDKCREVGWQMSVAGVVKTWVDSILLDMEARELRRVDGIPDNLGIVPSEISVAHLNSESGGKETSEANAGVGMAEALTENPSTGRAKDGNSESSVMKFGDTSEANGGMLNMGIAEPNEKSDVDQGAWQKKLEGPSRKQAMAEREDDGVPDGLRMDLIEVRPSDAKLEISCKEANAVRDRDGHNEILPMEQINYCRKEAVDARGDEGEGEILEKDSMAVQLSDGNLEITHEGLNEMRDGDAHNEILQMELSNTLRKEMIEGQVGYEAQDLSRIHSNEVCGIYNGIIFSGTEPDNPREGNGHRTVSHVNICDSKLEESISEQIEARVGNQAPESSGVRSSGVKGDHVDPATMQVDDL
jgi:hypothetical protein